MSLVTRFQSMAGCALSECRQNNTRALVIGGSLGGLAAGIQLHHAGCDVEILRVRRACSMTAGRASSCRPSVVNSNSALRLGGR